MGKQEDIPKSNQDHDLFKVDTVDESKPSAENVDLKLAAIPAVEERSLRSVFLRTIPILADEACERFAFYGIAGNMIVYMTIQLNVPNSEAVQKLNAWAGACYMTPLFGAWLADTFLGRFRTMLAFSFIYLVGLIGLTLSAGLDSLHPALGLEASSSQLGFFWAFMYLIAVGTGGIKPCVGTFGADQFDENSAREQAMIPSFYNYFYGVITIGSLLATTLIVWIQTDVSWMVGFLVPTCAMALAIVSLVSGMPWYRHKPPGGSSFNRWARVFAGAIAHWKAVVPNDGSLLHEVDTPMSIVPGQHKLLRTPEFRWLEKAAVPTKAPGVHDKWLVTLTEVEELKCVVRLTPIILLYASFIFVYSHMTSLYVLQGHAMDRTIGSWSVPPACMHVLDTVSVLVVIPLYDLVLVPFCERIGHPITRLMRIGVGLFVLLLSMICAAVVEVVRLRVVDRHDLQDVLPYNNSVPMSVWWQTPQYFLVGVSEVFAIIGTMEFFYSQSPEAMRSVASSLQLMSAGIGFFVATAVVTAVAGITTRNGSPGWIAANLNQGHLDYYYWLLTVLLAITLLLYIPYCYKYRYLQDPLEEVRRAAAADTEKGQEGAPLGDAHASSNLSINLSHGLNKRVSMVFNHDLSPVVSVNYDDFMTTPADPAAHGHKDVDVRR